MSCENVANEKEIAAPLRAAKRSGKLRPCPPLTLLAARIDDASRQPAGSPLLHPSPPLAPVDATECPSLKTGACVSLDNRSEKTSGAATAMLHRTRSDGPDTPA